MCVCVCVCVGLKKNLGLLSYLVCIAKIWLNHLMDDRHLSYITKLPPKKKNKNKNHN
jgi:hypothetical protein